MSQSNDAMRPLARPGSSQLRSAGASTLLRHPSNGGTVTSTQDSMPASKPRVLEPASHTSRGHEELTAAHRASSAVSAAASGRHSITDSLSSLLADAGVPAARSHLRGRTAERGSSGRAPQLQHSPLRVQADDALSWIASDPVQVQAVSPMHATTNGAVSRERPASAPSSTIHAEDQDAQPEISPEEAERRAKILQGLQDIAALDAELADINRKASQAALQRVKTREEAHARMHELALRREQQQKARVQAGMRGDMLIPATNVSAPATDDAQSVASSARSGGRASISRSLQSSSSAGRLRRAQSGPRTQAQVSDESRPAVRRVSANASGTRSQKALPAGLATALTSVSASQPAVTGDMVWRPSAAPSRPTHHNDDDAVTVRTSTWPSSPPKDFVARNIEVAATYMSTRRLAASEEERLKILLEDLDALGDTDSKLEESRGEFTGSVARMADTAGDPPDHAAAGTPPQRASPPRRSRLNDALGTGFQPEGLDLDRIRAVDTALLDMVDRGVASRGAAAGLQQTRAWLVPGVTTSASLQPTSPPETTRPSTAGSTASEVTASRQQLKLLPFFITAMEDMQAGGDFTGSTARELGAQGHGSPARSTASATASANDVHHRVTSRVTASGSVRTLGGSDTSTSVSQDVDGHTGYGDAAIAEQRRERLLRQRMALIDAALSAIHVGIPGGDAGLSARVRDAASEVGSLSHTETPGGSSPSRSQRPSSPNSLISGRSRSSVASAVSVTTRLTSADIDAEVHAARAQLAAAAGRMRSRGSPSRGAQDGAASMESEGAEADAWATSLAPSTRIEALLQELTAAGVRDALPTLLEAPIGTGVRWKATSTVAGIPSSTLQRLQQRASRLQGLGHRSMAPIPDADEGADSDTGDA